MCGLLLSQGQHAQGQVRQTDQEPWQEWSIQDEDLEEILREDLERHADFNFDEVEVVNNRPMPAAAAFVLSSFFSAGRSAELGRL